jgi:hypothetical protein
VGCQALEISLVRINGGCSPLIQGQSLHDGVRGWEHGWDHAAPAGKQGRQFTLTVSCRPHPDRL